jgi:hypothetical protein
VQKRACTGVNEDEESDVKTSKPDWEEIDDDDDDESQGLV